VVRVDDADYPGFCRVIWHAHVREMSDLPPADARHLMDTVLCVEQLVRQLTGADKINLASFGNVVPHLHWHIIPRWTDDKHFPQPIWGTPQRPGCGVTRPPIASELFRAALAEALATLPQGVQ